MRPLDRRRLRMLLGCIGAGAFARCLVFDGKTARQPDGAIDSGAGDSEPDIRAGPDTGAGPDTSAESDSSAESHASAESDAGAAPDTATPPDPGIRCGANDWCSRDTVCCLKLGASGWFGPSTRCSAPGTCDNFSQFACDTARECGDGGASTDDSCCATRATATTEFQGSRCLPLGACAPASLAVMLCTPTDRAPCPAHQSCVAADAGELPPGYYACQ
jgi:hypothetical protein